MMSGRSEFAIRLNNIDIYYQRPTVLDPRLPPVDNVAYDSELPIIRVYGTTPDGEQVCAHIHGTLPYLYIEYPAPYEALEHDGGIDPNLLTEVIWKVWRSVDAALNASVQRSSKKPSQQNSAIRFVATVIPVKGIPFYGYHVGYRLFLKIYLFNPRLINRLAQLLEKGAILNRPLQPYEAHLGYIHQFMIDYNLYGCNYIRVSANMVRYRKIHEDYDADEDDEMEGSTEKKHDIYDAQMLGADLYPSQIYSGWEVDIRAKDILNTGGTYERFLHHEFTDPDAPSNPDSKLLKSLDELWAEHGSCINPDEAQPFSASAGTERARPVWLSEPSYRSELDKLKSYEQTRHGTIDPKTIPRQFLGIDDVFSAFESVQALNNYYPEEGLVPDYHNPTNQSGTGETMENRQKDIYLQGEEPIFDFDADDDDEYDEGVDDTYSQLYDNEWANDGPVDDENEEESDELNTKELGGTQEWEIPKVNIGLPSPSPAIGDIEDAVRASDDLDEVSEGRVTTPTPNPPSEHSQNQDRKRIAKQKRRDKIDSPRPESRNRPLSDEIDTTIDLEQAPAKPRTHYSGRVSKSSTSVTDPVLTSMQLLGDQGRIDQQIIPELASAKPEPFQSQLIDKELLQSLLLSGSSQHSTEYDDFIDNIYDAFEIDPSRQILIYPQIPPTTTEAEYSLLKSDGALYQKAFYGNPDDVPTNPVEFGGEFCRLEVKDLSYYPVFDPLHEGRQGLVQGGNALGNLWVMAKSPPSYQEVLNTVIERKIISSGEDIGRGYRTPKSKRHYSQILGPTQKNKFGFKESQQLAKKIRAKDVSGNMTIMSLEVHVNTREHFTPDPQHDPVECIFWAMQISPECEPLTGLILVGDECDRARIRRFRNVDLRMELTETGLFNALIDIVRDLDPDILAGYEVHSLSWGYVIDRAKHAMDIQLTDDLSRVRFHGRGRSGKDNDRWGFNKSAAIKVIGRHTLNIWRAIKGGIALNSYRLENVVFHQLSKRIPHYAFGDLTKWYRSRGTLGLDRVLRYYLMRTRLNLELLEKEDFVTRISEQARIIGIDFNQVLSRGSQLKVESLMFRIAKPESFMLVSPSRKQVAEQNAIECKPLIMEPRSRFYTDPIVVLDFQSLYPSIMIAHNYCYSTCLGRIQDGWSGKNKLGFKKHHARSPGLLKYAEDHLNISPNGLVFVDEKFRQSLLSKMLQEILDTRVMVKKRMKDPSIDRWTKRQLNGRQLALKLIANVTYGYTSATFSGRMPCVEIADSIVQTGRETLEKAIAMIKREAAWGAEVVYGDTDSLFVHLPGKTKDQAFDIGEQIAARVTAMNPSPVKLQFEKVYHPSILLAMKRYVGYKYEHREQKEPDFDAKGIEVIRRDGTPALQKLERRCIDILFKTKDVSKVKEHCQAEWIKIMKDRVSIQDFCIAKEVKLGTYKEGAPPQAGVVVAMKRMAKDPRNEPQYGERVPYVIVAGKSKKISDRAMEVEELLRSDRHVLDAAYYIGRTMVKAMHRIFSVVGSDVQDWWNRTPKYQPLREVTSQFGPKKESEIRVETLELLLSPSTNICPLCEGEKEDEDQICMDCQTNVDGSFYEIRRRMIEVESKVANLNEICRSCAGLASGEEVACDSIDCPVYFARVRESTKLKSYQNSESPLIELLEEGPPSALSGESLPEYIQIEYVTDSEDYMSTSE